MIRLSLVSIVAVALAASGAESQRRTEVPPGARVRVAAPVFVNGVEVPGARRPATGTLVSVDSASLTVRTDEALLTLPFDAIRRLDVSRGTVPAREGRSRGLRTGAVAGGGFTAGAYALLYLFQVAMEAVSEDECDPENARPCSLNRGDPPDLPYMVPAIAVGTIGGGILGAALGSRERERWEGVRPRSLAPTQAPIASVSVSVSF